MAQLASRYLRPVVRADKCADGDTSGMCEKPVPWQKIAFPVTLTIGYVLFLALEAVHQHASIISLYLSTLRPLTIHLKASSWPLPALAF